MLTLIKQGLMVAGMAALLTASGMAQATVTYNASNGQLTVDTTSGVGGAGFNLVSLKVPGPQATTIDRWSDGTSQDGVSSWVQSFTTHPVSGVTAEQWVGLSNGGNSSPNIAVPPGVYQIATYNSGLAATAFTGDAGAGIAAGQIELGGWDGTGTPGTIQYATVSIQTVAGLPCDFVGAAGCNIDDIDALYAGANGAPSPLNDTLINTWLTQASAANNPLKLASSHVYRRGDANLDGTVDSTDLGLHLNNFGASGLDWSKGNFNSDGEVNSTDLGLLLNNFGFTSSTTASVPEPGSSTLFMGILFGLFPLVRRHRKRSSGTLLR